MPRSSRTRRRPSNGLVGAGARRSAAGPAAARDETAGCIATTRRGARERGALRETFIKQPVKSCTVKDGPSCGAGAACGGLGRRAVRAPKLLCRCAVWAATWPAGCQQCCFGTWCCGQPRCNPPPPSKTRRAATAAQQPTLHACRTGVAPLHRLHIHHPESPPLLHVHHSDNEGCCRDGDRCKAWVTTRHALAPQAVCCLPAPARQPAWQVPQA